MQKQAPLAKHRAKNTEIRLMTRSLHRVINKALPIHINIKIKFALNI